MLTILLTAIISQPVPLQHGPLREDSIESARANVIAELNRYRQHKLVLDDKLTAQAQRHAEVMASSNRLDHSVMVKTLPVPSGENIARGQRQGKETIDDWLTSYGHRMTMLQARYSRAGVGLAQSSDGVWYWSLQLEP